VSLKNRSQKGCSLICWIMGEKIRSGRRWVAWDNGQKARANIHLRVKKSIRIDDVNPFS